MFPNNPETLETYEIRDPELASEIEERVAARYSMNGSFGFYSRNVWDTQVRLVSDGGRLLYDDNYVDQGIIEEEIDELAENLQGQAKTLKELLEE